MSELLTESVQRVVFMEADLARIVEATSNAAQITAERAMGDLAEITERLVANQQQVIETLILIAAEIAALKAT